MTMGAFTYCSRRTYSKPVRHSCACLDVVSVGAWAYAYGVGDAEYGCLFGLVIFTHCLRYSEVLLELEVESWLIGAGLYF